MGGSEEHSNERVRLQFRFFHTTMKGNKLSTENLQSFLKRNLARYVFSRAQLEDYRVNDDLDSAVAGAMLIMAENGDSSAEGTGNMLDEILIYAFLEEKLRVPKLKSRVEMKLILRRWYCFPKAKPTRRKCSQRYICNIPKKKKSSILAFSFLFYPRITKIP